MKYKESRQAEQCTYWVSDGSSGKFVGGHKSGGIQQSNKNQGEFSNQTEIRGNIAIKTNVNISVQLPRLAESWWSGGASTVLCFGKQSYNRHKIIPIFVCLSSKLERRINNYNSFVGKLLVNPPLDRFSLYVAIRDTKTYQCANNVVVKKSYLG